MSLKKQQKCEGCDKQPSYGLPAEGKLRWCGGCAEKGAVMSLLYRHFGTGTTKFSCHMSILPGKLGPHVHPDIRVDATTLVL